MMKKILSLFLVLAMASVASAAAVWFEVDSADAKDHYEGSDVITINVLADFDIASFKIGAISSSDGTAEAIGGLHPNLNVVPYEGDIINTGGILILDIHGDAGYGAPPAYAYEVLYSFEFHVPYGLDPSTYIMIDDYTDTSAQPPIYTAIADPYWMYYIEDVEPAVIHVIPEPMTILLLGLGGLFLRRRK
jgi:hypothetical protein